MSKEKIDLTELDKLEMMLQDAGIEYEREDSSNGRTGFLWEFHQLRDPERTFENKWIWDVVCNTGSYGCELGLLELWGKDMNHPEGWLMAEECFARIKEILKHE